MIEIGKDKDKIISENEERFERIEKKILYLINKNDANGDD